MNQQLRTVMVSEHVKQEHGGRWNLEEKGIATFHAFGMNYQEFESGAGNFSTAIVEWPDGRIDNVPVEHVRFITPTTPEKTA
jgi:hypothetical protein